MLAYVYATAIILAGLTVSLLPAIGIDPFARAQAGRAESCTRLRRDGAWELGLKAVHPTIEINVAGSNTPRRLAGNLDPRRRHA